MVDLRGLRIWALAIALGAMAGCAITPQSSGARAGAAATTSSTTDAAPRTEVAGSPTPPNQEQIDADDAMELRAAAQAANDAEVHYGNIWERVRAGFAVPDMQDPRMTPYVEQWIQWYSARPDYVARMTERSRKYMFYILQEVQRRGLPTELALLPFVESAFNPDALSTAKASGMWQFIPSTGKHYNLQQTMFQDGRRDVLASTRAALDYLTKLHAMFGDWQLALAAYNWGEGGVQRAVAANQARGLPTDYASLNMPAETRNYYPKLQAVKDIIENPAKYGITLPDIPDHPYFKILTVQQDIDVDVAARLANISVGEFRALNPSFRKPVILAATKPRLLLPYDNATAFEQALASRDAPLASWTAYTVRATTSPSELARTLHLSEATLRGVNGIPPRTLVKAGSTLLIPKSPEDDRDVSANVAQNAVLALAPARPPGRRLHVRAGLRDTPASIARRFHLRADEVARWNHVGPSTHFKRHAMVVVFVHTPPRASRRAPAHRGRRVLVASRHVRHAVHLRHARHVVVASTRFKTRRIHGLRATMRASARHHVRVAQR